MSLHRLLYRSEADLRGGAAEQQEQLARIIAASQAANARAGLTGALLYARGTFVQALEGPLAAVEETFERICCDLRHRDVMLQEFTPASERVFAEWSMGRIVPSAGFETLVPGLADGSAQVVDTSSAQALIQLMRTLMLVQGDGARPQEPVVAINDRRRAID